MLTACSRLPSLIAASSMEDRSLTRAASRMCCGRIEDLEALLEEGDLMIELDLFQPPSGVSEPRFQMLSSATLSSGSSAASAVSLARSASKARTSLLRKLDRASAHKSFCTSAHCLRKALHSSSLTLSSASISRSLALAVYKAFASESSSRRCANEICFSACSSRSKASLSPDSFLTSASKSEWLCSRDSARCKLLPSPCGAGGLPSAGEAATLDLL
mmetsp:Transcript_67624/g.162350  ORF Transcript_67624/g.162350 Transcript_67624/m.162350 type:complete len:217 (+) Transcript_67624:656-1306(+)